MEGGSVNDFLDCFTYEGVYVVYQNEKYFTDGIRPTKNKTYSFFVMVLNDKYEWVRDVFEFEGATKQKCFDAFTTTPFWNGKTFYEAEKDMEWTD